MLQRCEHAFGTHGCGTSAVILSRAKDPRIGLWVTLRAKSQSRTSVSAVLPVQCGVNQRLPWSVVSRVDKSYSAFSTADSPSPDRATFEPSLIPVTFSAAMTSVTTFPSSILMVTE